MKKRIILLSSLALLTLVGCNNSNTGGAQTDIDFSILNPVTKLEQGDTYLIETSARNGVHYSSSQNTILSVSSNGKLTAKKAGTATITCTYNGQSDCFTVDVNDDFKPVINMNFNDDSLVLFKNQTFTLDPYLTYKGSKVSSDELFNFDTEKVGTVEVSANGVLKAKKTGTSKIYVSTTHRFYDVEKEFDVQVIDANYVYFRSALIELSSLDENGYIDTMDISPTVIVNGEVVNNPSITYDNSDPTVATIENGVVKAHAAGETTITAHYNDMQTSCVVRVYHASIETDLKLEFEGGKPLNLPTIDYADFKDSNVKAIYFDGKDISKEGKIDPSKIVGSPNYQNLIIETNKASYNVKAIVYNLVIRTAADFVDAYKKLYEYEATMGDPSKGYYYDGYVVVDADIDFGGESCLGLVNAEYCCLADHEDKSNTNGGYSNNTQGFAGTFDGRNHKFSNVLFDKVGSGIIGSAIKKSVIKNFTIENVSINKRRCAAVAAVAHNSSVFENIKIIGKIENGIGFAKESGGTRYNSYTATGFIVATLNTSSVSFKNIYMELTAPFEVTDDKRIAYFGYHYAYFKQGKFENVNIVGETDVIYGYSDGTSSTYDFIHATSKDNLEGINYFATKQAYLNAGGNN